MEVKKYRKKPVVIEAIRLAPDNFDAVCDFLGTTPIPEHNPDYGVDENGTTNEPYLGVYIDTLEGTMLAKNGDYIIRGVKGEFYPCKPDIFAATYELADEPSSMTFGQAIEALKVGKKVAREGWNGKGMFIYFTRGRILTEARDDVPSEVIREKGFCSLNPHIDMKAADDSIVCGWVASQTDMLAEDWVIVE